MPFEKGKSGNPGGRPFGSKNKATSHIRSAVEDFISRKITEIDVLWADLQPQERISFLTKLLDYILPKLRSQSLTISDFESLSDEDLRKLAQEVINQSNMVSDESTEDE